MTDPTLPTREEIVERVADQLYRDKLMQKYRPALRNVDATATTALDSLTLLDLAAEMERRGAAVMSPDGSCPVWEITFPAPQEKDDG